MGAVDSDSVVCGAIDWDVSDVDGWGVAARDDSDSIDGGIADWVASDKFDSGVAALSNSDASDFCCWDEEEELDFVSGVGDSPSRGSSSIGVLARKSASETVSIVATSKAIKLKKIPLFMEKENNLSRYMSLPLPEIAFGAASTNFVAVAAGDVTLT